MSSAWSTAEQLLASAVELAGDDEELRCSALVALGIARHRLRRADDARDLLHQALTLARRHRLPIELAETTLALVGRGGRGAATGMTDAEQANLLRDALAALATWPMPAGSRADADVDRTRDLLTITLEGELALALLFTDQVAERHALVLAGERRVRTDPHADADLVARALLNARLAKNAPEQLDDRLADTQEVLAYPEHLLTPEARIAALTYRHEDLLRRGDRTAARDHLREARIAADRHGHPFWQWATLTWESLGLAIDGRTDEAERLLSTTMATYGAAQPEVIACGQVQLVCIRLLQGRAREVTDAMAAAAAANPLIPCYRAVHALALAEAGDLAAAGVVHAAFRAHDYADLPDDSNRFLALAVLGDVAADLGDADAAAVLHRLLVPYAGQQVLLNCYGGGGAHWGPTDRVLGRLAHAMGRADEANSWFASARACAVSVEAPLALARVDRDAGAAPHSS